MERRMTVKRKISMINTVHHVQTFISHYLQSINYSVTTMHEFYDGCQSQYKSRNCVGNIAESFQDLGYSNKINFLSIPALNPVSRFDESPGFL
jgi:hypothetical protein